MTNDDETAPIDDEALEQIRAEAMKQQRSADDTADVPGARRRPRKRTNPPKQTAPDANATATFTQLLNDAPSTVEAEADLPRRAEARVAEHADAAGAYWQPGSRLSTRVNPNPVPARAKSSDRGLIIAAVILLVALLVAIGLYLVANAIVSDDDLAPETQQQTEQSE